MPKFRRTAAIVLAVLSILAHRRTQPLAKSGGNSSRLRRLRQRRLSQLHAEPTCTTFKNEGDCTKYTAKGGVLKPVVVVQRVFARAWTDRNANQTFDADIDTLIAELVDANGDQALGAGDNYKVYGLPTDLTGTGFATCSATSHIITGVDASSTANTLIVAHESGMAWFVSQSGLEEFRDEGPLFESRLSDQHLLDHHFPDEIIVSASSPCLPSSSANMQGLDTGNNTFLDVAIYP